MLSLNADRMEQVLGQYDGFQTVGKLHSANGLLTAHMPVAIGALCELHLDKNRCRTAEVVGFDGDLAQILPFESIGGLSSRATVTSSNRRFRVPVGPQLLGRVINGVGQPVDGMGPIRTSTYIDLDINSPLAMHRERISEPFVTGQRVLDGCLTFGKGQRVGLFAGSGVGKSTLLGEIAKGAQSDINVIALIGERGREVRPFLDDCLGSEGLAKSIVVVSTADETPLMRIHAAQVAIALASFHRDEGQDALLLLDSMTRIAMAQREIGLLLGEPPSTRGYTPSVFTMLSKLLEQLGAAETGTITGIVTVLVDGDDMDEPIADCVRGIVDGHIVLNRALAERAHFPAIDVVRSVSRVIMDITSSEHLAAAQTLRQLLATYEEVAELVQIGAYRSGSNIEVDRAIALMPAVNAFLRQAPRETSTFADTVATLQRIASAWKQQPREVTNA
ncbi:MAG: FliI/YscN family ATPase [Planctomycetales bacterium]|nr:FliI/YscN family ATPase [Planctomycetales bacterium]